MTLREALQTIGLIRTTKVVTEKKAKKSTEKSVFGFGVDGDVNNLVSETRASSKLLRANQGWVYKNNDVIAKEVGSIEFELHSFKLVGTEIVFTPILQHPILDALDRFNSFQSASDAFYLTESHKNLAGDAFWYIEGEGVNIKNIYLLQPDAVQLKLGKPVGGQKIIQGYKYELSVDGDTIKETYTPEEIIQFKDPNPENQYRGKSKVEAAAEAIDTDNYAIEANKNFFKRGMLTNFILTSDNKMNDTQQKSIQAQIKNAFSGVANAFRVPVFWGGLKPMQISLSNKDTQFIEQQKWLRDKIMSIFGNNQAILGITEDVNRANADATILNWKRTTIKAELKSIADTLNEFLVPRFGETLILTFKDPVPEDRSSKIEEVKTLREAKIITQNEGREMLGFDPVKDKRADELNGEEVVNVPEPIKRVDYMKVLRKSKIFAVRQKVINEKKIKELALQTARQIITGRKKSIVVVKEQREHEEFTNEQVWSFHNKQIRIVEALESVFHNKVEQFINKMIERALENLPASIPKSFKKALVDEDYEVQQATIDFTPILNEVAILSGQSALSFIDVDEPYLGLNIKDTIEVNVRRFAKSMVQTDREKLIQLLSEGLANGDSVPKIRTSIQDYFKDYSKVQAERITRSEVIRASNLATIDAWEQSNVVVGKQWLTAEDERVCAYCAPMNGKIIELMSVFFKKGDTFYGSSETPLPIDYTSIKGGNLHVNCRCTLLPVLKGQKGFDAETYLRIKGVEKDKAELETKLDDMDKRTSEYKESVKKLEDYIKELEDFING